MSNTSDSLVKAVRAKTPPRMGLITWEPWIVDYIGADKMECGEWVNTYAAYHEIVVKYGVNSDMLSAAYGCGRLNDLMVMYGQNSDMVGDLRIDKRRSIGASEFMVLMLRLSDYVPASSPSS
jgi:hypothetical protein